MRPHTAPSSKTDAEILAEARKAVAQWKQKERSKWSQEQATTFKARLQEEFERLVHVFAGPEGLQPSAWRHLSNKLAVVAERNVRRQDKIAMEKVELEVWNSPDVDRNALQQARRNARQSDEGSEGDLQASATGGQEQLPEWAIMASKQPGVGSMRRSNAPNYHTEHSMRRSSMRRSSSADYPVMMSGIGSLRPTHAADYDRVCDMIYALNTKATLQERVNLSPSKGTKERGFNFGNQASPRRKAMREAAAAAMDAASRRGSSMQGPESLIGDMSKGPPQRTSQGGTQQCLSSFGDNRRMSINDRRMSVSDRRMSKSDRRMSASDRRMSTSSRTPGGNHSSDGSTAALRKIAGTKARRLEDLGPLAAAYDESCKEVKQPYNSSIAEALCDSDPSMELSLVGTVLNGVAATPLAKALTLCSHLTSISFTRTVLNPEALDILLPAARTLRLRSLIFRSSNLTPEVCPTLVTALSRPTVSHVRPPSEWWLTLNHMDLGGNPLGDQGLTTLIPALPQLQALTSLSLRQTSLTDWAAPQVEQLMRILNQLTFLDLGHNQLGPMAGKGVAGALVACSKLETLDLSWNPLGSSVQHICWALFAPRFAGCFTLKSLILAGCDLESEDHMAMAAFLRFGIPGVPLESLDLSHTPLLGVSAQCLLRQLDRLLPPSTTGPLHPEQEHVTSSTHDTDQRVKTPTKRNALTEQQQVEEEHRQEQLRRSKPPCLDHVNLMGCRVDLDGGKAPAARMKASTFPRSAHDGKKAKALRARQVQWEKGGPLDAHARHKLSCGRSGDELPKLQHYTLDLAVERPDRVIARMLVQHELDARRHKIMCWYNMVLNGRTIRWRGQDVVPFDIMYEGWNSDDALPSSGKLELGVACLPELASPWWMNNRLQFNAAHILAKHEQEAHKGDNFAHQIAMLKDNLHPDHHE